MLKWFFTLGLFIVCLPSSFGVEPAKANPAEISYYKEIRPIFQQHCQGCHQPAKPLGAYIMTSYADLLKKGDREKPGVVPGKPEASHLIEQIEIVKGHAEMPKGKDPLPEPQIQLIRNWILQGAKDDTPKSAQTDLIDADHPPVYRNPAVITDLAFSMDSKLLAVSGYHEVFLYAADEPKLIARLIGLSERIQSLAFSPDGKWLAVSGGEPGRFGELQIWSVEKQKLKLSIPVSFDTVYGVSWSPDSKIIACGCADNTIRAFDIADGKQILFQGAHGDWVLGTSFSIDGTYLISVSRDRTVKLTEVATQRFIDNVTSITPGALKGGLITAKVRPSKELKKIKRDEGSGGGEVIYNELLAAGADGTPRLYRMHRQTKRVIGDDANKIHEYEKLIGRIHSVSFDSEGKRFAAVSSLDSVGQMKIYEVDSKKVIAKFDAPKSALYAVAFRPDGKAIASGGFDGMIRIHQPTDGKVIKEWQAIPLKK